MDASYTSAELTISTQHDFGVTLLGPLRVDNSAQARTQGGFDRAAFTIDWGPPAGHLPARGGQHDLVGLHRTRPGIDRGALSRHGLSSLPGPSTVHDPPEAAAN